MIAFEKKLLIWLNLFYIFYLLYFFIPGGHKEFHRKHREFCEDTLLPNGSNSGGSSPAARGVLGSPLPGSPLSDPILEPAGN